MKLPDPRKCKHCGKNGRVINTRTDPKGYRWRRRACLACNWRWFTYETMIDPRDANNHLDVVVPPLRDR